MGEIVVGGGCSIVYDKYFKMDTSKNYFVSVGCKSDKSGISYMNLCVGFYFALNDIDVFGVPIIRCVSENRVMVDYLPRHYYDFVNMIPLYLCIGDGDSVYMYGIIGMEGNVVELDSDVGDIGCVGSMIRVYTIACDDYIMNSVCIGEEWENINVMFNLGDMKGVEYDMCTMGIYVREGGCMRFRDFCVFEGV